MEQRHEAASDHASVLTCSFLFRALARLQPPAGLIETAMGIEDSYSSIAVRYIQLVMCCFSMVSWRFGSLD